MSKRSLWAFDSIMITKKITWSFPILVEGSFGLTGLDAGFCAIKHSRFRINSDKGIYCVHLEPTPLMNYLISCQQQTGGVESCISVKPAKTILKSITYAHANAWLRETKQSIILFGATTYVYSTLTSVSAADAELVGFWGAALLSLLGFSAIFWVWKSKGKTWKRVESSPSGI